MAIIIKNTQDFYINHLTVWASWHWEGQAGMGQLQDNLFSVFTSNQWRLHRNNTTVSGARFTERALLNCRPPAQECGAGADGTFCSEPEPFKKDLYSGSVREEKACKKKTENVRLENAESMGAK